MASWRLAVGMTCLALGACARLPDPSIHGTQPTNTVAIISLDDVLRAETLRDRADVQTAFRAIEADRERNNAQMVALNEIPTPPFGESKRAARVAEMFRDLSLNVHLDDVGNIGEEGLGDWRGAKHLYREGTDHPDSMIAIDGGGLERLIHGGVGSNRYRVTYHGPGGHRWGRFGLVNPHHALARAAAQFPEQAVSVTSEGPKSSFTVGRVGGGTSINSIPFESWMEVDIRSGDVGKLADVDAIFQDAVQAGLLAETTARTRDPELTVDVDQAGLRPAGFANPDTPMVRHAVAAMRAMGVEPRLTVSSTDANIPIARLPAVTISRGGKTTGAHSLDETWEDVDAHLGIQQALLLTLLEAGVSE